MSGKCKPSSAIAAKINTVDYEVGYGKPPKRTRFKKGRSGNPNGRPKGSKNKPDRNMSAFREMLMLEVNREVEIHDKSGPVRMAVLQAAMRSLCLSAAKGNVSAQKLLMQIAPQVEDQLHEEKLEEAKTYIEYQETAREKIKKCEEDGEEPPEMYPHPDDIDTSSGEVIFRGPRSKEEVPIWEKLHNALEESKSQLRGEHMMLQGHIDSYKKHGRDDDRESAVRFAENVEILNFTIELSALKIHRRWRVPFDELVDEPKMVHRLNECVRNGGGLDVPDSVRIHFEKAYQE